MIEPPTPPPNPSISTQTGVGGGVAQQQKDMPEETKTYLSEVERRDMEMVRWMLCGATCATPPLSPAFPPSFLDCATPPSPPLPRFFIHQPTYIPHRSKLS